MIFSIEKRRFRRGGKVEETRSYYLRYRIGDMPVDKWKSLGVTDKQVADQKAHKFIQEREREAAGILEPQAVRDSARKPLAAHPDADVPFVVVRDYAAKNKKEESVQLVPEIVEALTAHRPAGCAGTDLVFPKGIPRARRLTLDAEANGIPYRDELGRYGDFHALRYTWATFLQRNGVAQRFAMKLMRHSDIRLTAQVYTDEMQLPIYDAIKNLPRLDAMPGYTQIRAQILGGNGQTVSQPDAKTGESNPTETLVNRDVCHVLSQPVTSCQMERVKGIEPSFRRIPFYSSANL
jgi:hypothetical protein